MKRVIFAVLIAAPASAAADDAALKKGAQAYRACVACHALEPGLHLGGPSLAGFWNREAGAAPGFSRYSQGLKDAEFSWNAAALDGWLKNPADMIPGTSMSFRGIADDQLRADLVAFLEYVGQPGGPEQAVAEGLIPQGYIRGPAPPPLKDAPARARVVSMRHCGDGYNIRTADGEESVHWEKNIRLKLDSADTGPPEGVAVMLGAGMQGDRYSVIFRNLDDLNSIVSEECD